MERALDRALPLLKPGKSLQFLVLPAGLDPDDIIQKQSKQAFADLLKTAKPCIQAFWEINTAGKDISTPERMAKLQDDILKKCETITNPIVAELYKKQMNKKLWALKNTKNKSKIKLQPIIAPQKNTFEGRMLVAYILTFPELAGQFLEQIMNLKVSEPFLATILNNVIPQVAENPDISREELCNQLTDKDKLFLKAELEILKDKDIFVATNEFKELLNFWQNKSAEEELETALKEYENNPTEEGWNNIMRLKQNL